MSSPDDSVRAPALPAPVPRRTRLPLFQFFRTLRDNMIATYAEEAYERDIVQRKMFGRSRFLVNEPEAIKRVLLDNAANYQKSEITRRILEPGLGDSRPEERSSAAQARVPASPEPERQPEIDAERVVVPRSGLLAGMNRGC